MIKSCNFPYRIVTYSSEVGGIDDGNSVEIINISAQCSDILDRTGRQAFLFRDQSSSSVDIGTLSHNLKGIKGSRCEVLEVVW